MILSISNEKLTTVFSQFTVSRHEKKTGICDHTNFRIDSVTRRLTILVRFWNISSKVSCFYDIFTIGPLLENHVLPKTIV